MVQGVPALLLPVEFEHREFNDPRRPPVAVIEAEVAGDAVAQRAEAVVDDLRLVRAEEDQIAVPGLDPIQQIMDHALRQELEDGRLQPVAAFARLVDLDVGEPLCAVVADERRVFIDRLAAEIAAPRDAQRGDPAVVPPRRLGKDLELNLAHQVRHFREFQRVAQVRAIGPEAAHGLGIGEARKRRGQIDADGLAEQIDHHLLHERGDPGLVHERGLDIELGEFRLPVGAQVFIPEAAHDLVIAIEAGHHQQLLEQLRRLRQGEKRAGLGAARHQVVARAFRRRPGQHRGFDLEKAVAIEKAAQDRGHPGAQPQVVLHGRAAQIDVAVAQARLVLHVFLVELERRRERSVEDLHRPGQDLDLAGGEIPVYRALRPVPDPAGDAQHVFVAHRACGVEGRRVIRIAHDLHQALAVAQIDEDHAAVIAPPVHPAAERHVPVDQRGIQLAAIMAAHAAPLQRVV